MNYLKVSPYQPTYKDISKITETLLAGGIVVFPTDSALALGCLVSNHKGIKRILKITGKKEKKSNMSLLFNDLKSVAQYTEHYNNTIFRAVKSYTPGPYTFIFNANKEVTKRFENGKKEVGVRLPEHPLLQAILESLSEPIISTTLNGPNFDQYNFQVELIADAFGNEIDLYVDDGLINNDETTVIDCTSDEMELIRQGVGEV